MGNKQSKISSIIQNVGACLFAMIAVVLCVGVFAFVVGGFIGSFWCIT